MTRLAAGLGLATLLLLAGAGAADARTMQDRLVQACAVDIARLCPDATMSDDDVNGCLLTHRQEVSAGCIALVEAAE